MNYCEQLLNYASEDKAIENILFNLIGKKLSNSIIYSILDHLEPFLLEDKYLSFTSSVIQMIINSSSDPYHLFDDKSICKMLKLINETNERQIIQILIDFYLKIGTKPNTVLLDYLTNSTMKEYTWSFLKKLLKYNNLKYWNNVEYLFRIAQKENFETASLSFIKFLKTLVFKASNNCFLELNGEYPITSLKLPFKVISNRIHGLNLIMKIYQVNKEQLTVSCAKKFLFLILVNWLNESSVNFLNESIQQLVYEMHSNFHNDLNESLNRSLELVLDYLNEKEKNIDIEDFGFQRHFYPSNYFILNIIINNAYNQTNNYSIHFDPQKTLNDLKERISNREKVDKYSIRFNDFTDNQLTFSLLKCDIKNHSNIKIQVNQTIKNKENSQPPSLLFYYLDFPEILLELLNNRSKYNIVARKILLLLPTSNSFSEILMRSEVDKDEALAFIIQILDEQNDFKSLCLFESLINSEINIFEYSEVIPTLINLFNVDFLKEDLIILLSTKYKSEQFKESDELCQTMINYLNQVKRDETINKIIQFLNKFADQNELKISEETLKIFENLDESFWMEIFELILKLVEKNHDLSFIFGYCQSKILNSKFCLHLITKIATLLETSQINTVYQILIEKISNFDDYENLNIITDILNAISELLQKIPTLIEMTNISIDKLIAHSFGNDYKMLQKSIFNFILTYSKISTNQEILDMIKTRMKEMINSSSEVFNYDPELFERNEPYSGLANLGCTCYLNAVFQQLYHIFPVRYLISTFLFDENDELISLQRIFVRMFYSTNKYIETSEFVGKWHGIDNELLNPRIQQDAVEFFLALINTKSKDFEEKIQNLFKGEMTEIYCGIDSQFHKSIKDPFLNISIPVSGYENIHSSLNDMNKEEIIHDYEFNKRRISIKKHSRISKLPPILVIQLKRFGNSIETNSRYKINDKFEFPVNLNIKKYCENDQNEDDFYMFDLNGIIIHLGIAEGGHYYSYIRKNENEWWSFNDIQVLKVNESDVFNDANENAYVLFYTKRDFELQENEHSISFINEFDYSKEVPNFNEIDKENTLVQMNKGLFNENVIDFIQSIDDPVMNLSFFIRIICHSKNNPKSNKILNIMKEMIQLQPNSIKDCVNYINEHSIDISKVFLFCPDENLISQLSEIILYCFKLIESSSPNEKCLNFFYDLMEQIIRNNQMYKKIPPMINLVCQYLVNYPIEAFQKGWIQWLISILLTISESSLINPNEISALFKTLDKILINIKNSDAEIENKTQNESENKEINVSDCISSLLSNDEVNIIYSLSVVNKKGKIKIKCEKHAKEENREILFNSSDFQFNFSDEKSKTLENSLMKQFSNENSVSIPEIGNVIISKNGNILLPNLDLSNPLLVSSTNRVFIQSGSFTDLFIFAENTIIVNNEESPTTKVSTLTINPINEKTKFESIKGSKLVVDNLNIPDSLIANNGTIINNISSNFENSLLLNNGDFSSNNINSLQTLLNSSKGKIHSTNELVITSSKIYNLGEIVAENIEIYTESLFVNNTKLQANQILNVRGKNIHNQGVIQINGDLEISCDNFKQFSEGQINSNQSSFHTKVAEFSGGINSLNIEFDKVFVTWKSFKSGEIETISIDKESRFIIDSNTDIEIIRCLKNEGGTIINNDFTFINTIINEKTGKIIIHNYLTANQMINKGYVIVFGGQIQEAEELLTTGGNSEKANLNLIEDYDGGIDSRVELTNGAHFAVFRYHNNGLLYSNSTLKIKENSNDHCYGNVYAKNTISFYSQNQLFSLSDETISPTIEGAKRDFIVECKGQIRISNSFNKFVSLQLKSKSIENHSIIVAERVYFNSDTIINKGQIISPTDISIKCHSLVNIRGRILAIKNVTIESDELVKNEGLKHFEKGRKQKMSNYDFAKGQLVPRSENGQYEQGQLVLQTKEINTQVYTPTIKSAGIISSVSGSLTIVSETIDNSLGIMHSKTELLLSAHKEAINEGGLIFSSNDISINSIRLKNGYLKGSNVFSSVNPNAPMIVDENIQNRFHIVPVLDKKKEGKAHWWRHRNIRWFLASPRNERMEDVVEKVVKRYENMPQVSSSSYCQGCIYSSGDVSIESLTENYLGTIVSAKDVSIKGKSAESINFKDRGTIIAKGNVNIELNQASLDRFSIEADNVNFRLHEDIIIQGLIDVAVMEDESVTYHFNLREFAEMMGMIINGSNENNNKIENKTNKCENLIDRIPEGRYVSTVTDETMREILILLLAPIYGRPVLESIDLVEKLDSYGKQLVNGIRNQRPSGISLALLYIKKDGQNGEVPLCDSYLLFSDNYHIPDLICARQRFSLKSDGNIKIMPGKLNILSNDFSLHSKKELKAESTFKYNSTGEKNSVCQLVMNYPGKISLSGDEGVETKASLIRANDIEINSSKGNVVDNSMSLDFQYAKIDDSTAIQSSRSFNSFFYAENSIVFDAKLGNIEQTGTNMLSGTGGVKYNSNRLTMNASYDRTITHKAENRTFAKYETKISHPMMIGTKGCIDLNSKNVDANGTQFEAKSLINKENGDVNFNAVYDSISIASHSRRAGTFGGGVSTQNDYSSKTVPRPVNIDAQEVLIKGDGQLALEGTNIKKPNMEITKNLVETTPKCQQHCRSERSRRGFFAPKIKGDPMLESLRSMNKSINAAGVVPQAIGTASTGIQTIDHFQTLSHLSSVPNPALALSQILLSRFVSGFGYYNIKQTVEQKESNPVQSRVEVGELLINNKKTHIEGKWKVDKARIKTEDFSQTAPKYTSDQSSKTKGFYISLNPAVILGSLALPLSTAARTVSMLPACTKQKANFSSHCERNVPSTFDANELHLQCDNAVLSGAQIQADLVEAVVNKKLTIESLTSMFDSTEKNSIATAYLPQVVNASNNDGDKMAAVPSLLSSERKLAAQKIDAVAKLVGRKKFYLNAGKLIYSNCSEIGLKSIDLGDKKNENETIIANEFEEKVIKEFYKEKNKVINPSISELATLRGQLNNIRQNSIEFNQNESENNDNK